MYFWIGFARMGQLPYLSLQVSQCSIDICLKHSCVSLEILKFIKFFHAHSRSFCFLSWFVAPDLQRFEFFSSFDTLLCCPYFAAVVVATAVGTQVEYKPDGSSVHV